jgi:hypothetical protein
MEIESEMGWVEQLSSEVHKKQMTATPEAVICEIHE